MERIISEKLIKIVKQKKILSMIFSLFRTFILIGLGFVLLYPLLYMISVSFRASEDLLDPLVVWIPKNLSIENIQLALQVIKYKTSAINSIKVSILGSIFTTMTASLVGYSFARFKFKFKGLLFSIVIFSIVVPPQVTMLPTYNYLRNFDFLGIGQLIGLITGNDLTINMIDTVWAIIIPAMTGVGIRGGLFIYIFRQFFRNMPKELEDAAYIDGYGPFGTFVKVMLPNAGSGYLTSFLFSLVWFWNDYINTSLLYNTNRTLSMNLSSINSIIDTMRNSNSVAYSMYEVLGAKQGACLLFILPILAVYIVLQKYFTESIERTGIVG